MENVNSREALKSLYDYLLKLIVGIENTVDYIRSQRIELALNVLPQVIEGLQWAIEVLHYTKDVVESYGNAFDEEKIKETFGDLLDAMEYDDTVLLSDILEYEIIDMLKGWQEGLEQILYINKEV